MRKRSVRILMLNYEFPPIGGGAGSAHRNLLLQFAQNSKLKIDVLTSSPESGVVTEPFAENIVLHRVGLDKKHLHFWRRIEVLQWLIRARRHYRRLTGETSYDLIHAFFGFPSGWLCRRETPERPYVISLRGSDVPGVNARLALEYKLLGSLVFKPIWRRASALVACSEGLKQRALAFMSSADIEVIPNGVDSEQFVPSDGGRARRPAGPLRLVTVGRLSATKRVDLLLDTIQHLRKVGVDVRLSVIGGGTLEPYLRRQAMAQRLADIVTFTGRVAADQMPQLYREHDLYISATMQEGMSNAMLEAMASGLPIVTTRCEGVEELVTDNGIVVDEPDPEALAEPIRRLANNRSEYRRMSVAGRERAEAFTWQAAASAYMDIYQRLVESRSK